MRERRDAKKTLLCAVKFWSIKPGVPTLRRGARSVALKQGYTAGELDRAERALIKGGYLRDGGQKSAKTLVVTPKGRAISCKTTKLAPWTNDGHPGAALEGDCGCGG